MKYGIPREVQTPEERRLFTLQVAALLRDGTPGYRKAIRDAFGPLAEHLGDVENRIRAIEQTREGRG